MKSLYKKKKKGKEKEKSTHFNSIRNVFILNNFYSLRFNIYYADHKSFFLETSGPFGNEDKVRINFDHHKGVFGSLAVAYWKTLQVFFWNLSRHSKSWKYCFSTPQVYISTLYEFNTLICIDKNLNFWSISFVSFCKEGFIELCREEFLDISPSFDDRLEFLPKSVWFFEKISYRTRNKLCHTCTWAKINHLNYLSTSTISKLWSPGSITAAVGSCRPAMGLKKVLA